MDDRLPDLAGSCRPPGDRDPGKPVVKTELVGLLSRPGARGDPTDFPTIAFRTVIRPCESIRDATHQATCETLARDEV
jgi:hypothetical protein